MERFEKVFGRIERTINFVGLGVLFMLVFLTTADVTGRTLFSRPILGTIDITQAALCIVVFFSLAYTQSLDGHVNIGVVVSRLRPRVQNIICSFNYLLAMGVFAALAWVHVSNSIAWARAGRETELLGIPLYILKGVISLGFALLSIRLLIQFLNQVMKYKKGK
ncbi:TRAP transporter small permease subunit [Chloroflexota bacterium]